MMSMVERVARALRRQWHIENFDRASEVGWENEIYAARAAIEAMREPTDAMVDAYDNMDVWDDDSTEPTAQRAMSAMIDAALNEQVAG